MGYGEFIQRYDRAGMLFYLDPPYWGCETDYGQDVFGRADFERLADQLAGIEGRFILSINDTPTIREIFAAFAIESVSTTYTLSKASAGAARELLISNLR